MQIHELSTRTTQATDWLALDTNSQTYKAKTGQLRPEFTSHDASNPASWDDIAVISSSSNITTFFERLSYAVKNLRYIWKLIGSSDFSNVAETISGAIGNTALTTTATDLSGAIAEHEEDISQINGNLTELSELSVEEISSSYSAYIRVFRYGYLRILVIESVSGLNASGETTIGTIPTKDRPSAQVNQDFFPPSGSNVNISLRAYVATNGNIKIYNYSSNTGTINVRIRVPYLVGV